MNLGRGPDPDIEIEVEVEDIELPEMPEPEVPGPVLTPPPTLLDIIPNWRSCADWDGRVTG